MAAADANCSQKPVCERNKKSSTASASLAGTGLSSLYVSWLRRYDTTASTACCRVVAPAVSCRPSATTRAGTDGTRTCSSSADIAALGTWARSASLVSGTTLVTRYVPPEMVIGNGGSSVDELLVSTLSAVPGVSNGSRSDPIGVT